MQVTDDFGNDAITYWQEEKDFYNREAYPWTRYVYFLVPELCNIEFE